MSRAYSTQRLPSWTARAVLNSVRVSPQKLGLVAGLIRGKTVGQALADLTFCEKRIAEDVKKVLWSAIANAENNHNLDADRLYISQVWVGRDFVLKRFQPRAKGRAGHIKKQFSNMTLVVAEMAGE